MKNLKIMLFCGALILSAFAFNATAQDKTNNEKMAEKPLVVLVRADWCGICKALEPKIDELMQSYADKFDFVVLNITDKEAIAKSAETAKTLGLSDFFAVN